MNYVESVNRTINSNVILHVTVPRLFRGVHDYRPEAN